MSFIRTLPNRVVSRNVAVRFEEPMKWKNIPKHMIVNDKKAGHDEALSGEWPPTTGLVDAAAVMRNEVERMQKREQARKLGAHKRVDIDPTETEAAETVSGEWPMINTDIYDVEKKKGMNNKRK